ncbi:hypothetical protein C9374_002842 [Naegleria lovaniensis]|uniref:Uncharacterized protein n=1 Tax=Naegleria lovaniensis TaxID=51637 RepID=A0AA88KME0_NAELO|nr:uncharacterized protein C9374_002842 [Naegleria lovaniensis]KAG2386396.1 hypothetical protein C9374_002842 [Naegleria lovaniensis]
MQPSNSPISPSFLNKFLGKSSNSERINNNSNSNNSNNKSSWSSLFGSCVILPLHCIIIIVHSSHATSNLENYFKKNEINNNNNNCSCSNSSSCSSSSCSSSERRKSIHGSSTATSAAIQQVRSHSELMATASTGHLLDKKLSMNDLKQQSYGMNHPPLMNHDLVLHDQQQQQPNNSSYHPNANQQQQQHSDDSAGNTTSHCSSSSSENDNMSSTSSSASPRSSSSSSKKAKISKRQTKWTLEDCGNVEFLRKRFIDYMEGHDYMNVKSPEIKLLFLDLFYETTRRNSKHPLTKCHDVLMLLEEFCKNYVTYLQLQNYFHIAFGTIEELRRTGCECPYLTYLSNQNNGNAFKGVKHETLEAFLSTSLSTLNSQVIQCGNSRENSEEWNTHNQTLESCLTNIGSICDMFYIELDDMFSYFQAVKSNRDLMAEWLKKGIENQTIPKNVIELYRKKLQEDERALEMFQFHQDDFNAKSIIDKDWEFSKYFTKNTISSDWFLTCKEFPKFIQWSTKSAYSNNDWDLRGRSKLIANLDYSIEDVVKSYNTDKHLAASFSNVKFDEYFPIVESSSLHKYPSGVMSSVLDLGKLVKKRKVKVIFSTKTKFVGNELTEFTLFYKSCELDKTANDDIKVTVVGTRVFTRLDKNRTRFSQVRMGNLGGFLNHSLIIRNKLAMRKIAREEYEKLMEMIEEAKQEGFPLPPLENNYLMRVWCEFCKHYCGVDIREKLK